MIDNFAPREGGYFYLKGGRCALTTLAADVTEGLELRVGYQSATDQATGVLYYWDGVSYIWRPALPLLQRRILIACAPDERWSERVEKDVMGALLRGAPPLNPTDEGWVAFANVCVADDDPSDWTPRMETSAGDQDQNYHYTGDWTAVIPHRIYLPQQFHGDEEFEAAMVAGTRKTSAFLGQVLPADAEEFAWEMLGNFLTTRRIDRKAILLRGEGMNGKSRLLKLIENLLGAENVSHLPLSAINKTSSPELGGLRDKLANIVDDMGTAVGKDTSNFKTTVTGGKITVNPKYQHPYEMEPKAKLAFAVNRLPHGSDNSSAWGSRWVTVPFDRTIPKEEQRPADEIDAELLAEAPWIVTRAMHACARLIARGHFSIPPSFDEAQEEFEEASNPVLSWLNDGGAVLDPDSRVLGADLLASFKASAHGSAYRNMPARIFYEHLRGVPGVETRRSTGKQIWIYGVKQHASLADSLYDSRGEV